MGLFFFSLDEFIGGAGGGMERSLNIYIYHTFISNIEYVIQLTKTTYDFIKNRFMSATYLEEKQTIKITTNEIKRVHTLNYV